MPGTGSFLSQKGGHTMHTHSSTIDPGRTLRPWELALLLAVCVTLLTGTWAQTAAGERPVRVSLGAEHYPTRDYGTFALPAGVYTSLRVTLGAGAGHNWWCVIFPPLCAQAAGLSERAVQALSDDDVRLVTESDGGYVVRFRLLELWDALVQRLS